MTLILLQIPFRMSTKFAMKAGMAFPQSFLDLSGSKPGIAQRIAIAMPIFNSLKNNNILIKYQASRRLFKFVTQDLKTVSPAPDTDAGLTMCGKKFFIVREMRTCRRKVSSRDRFSCYIKRKTSPF